MVANISPEAVFEIFFINLSNINIDFLDQRLRWRTYATKKTFPTTRYIKLVGKKKLIIIVLDSEHETFIVHVAFFSSFAVSLSSILYDADVHFSRRPQIAGLIVEEVLTKVLAKFLNFVDIFLLDLVSKLSKDADINDYAIKLVNSQQPFYGLIYSLRPVKLEILKIYIETNIANRFIRLSKSPVKTPIFFDWKSNKCFLLFVDY